MSPTAADVARLIAPRIAKLEEERWSRRQALEAIRSVLDDKEGDLRMAEARRGFRERWLRGCSGGDRELVAFVSGLAHEVEQVRQHVERTAAALADVDRRIRSLVSEELVLRDAHVASCVARIEAIDRVEAQRQRCDDAIRSALATSNWASVAAAEEPGMGSGNATAPNLAASTSLHEVSRELRTLAEATSELELSVGRPGFFWPLNFEAISANAYRLHAARNDLDDLASQLGAWRTDAAAEIDDAIDGVLDEVRRSGCTGP